MFITPIIVIKKSSPGTLTKPDLREIFLKFDVNKDGNLTRDEMKKAFEHLGALIPGYRAWDGMRRADENKDGLIEPEELDRLIDYAYDLQYKRRTTN